MEHTPHSDCYELKLYDPPNQAQHKKSRQHEQLARNSQTNENKHGENRQH